ncbi:MAG: hypothetical protein HY078_07020 [Elusimicrobia bacterium]|nr:hypothetical protein [Elusimicrobiota bacterium]
MKRKTLYKVTAALILSVIGVGAWAAIAAPASPRIFEGQYRLVEARAGLLCESTLRAWFNGSQVDLGPFSFIGVNQGRQTFEDGLEKSWSESYATENTLVFHRESFVKAIARHRRDHIEARLNGRSLLITSRGDFWDRSGLSGTTYHECVYRKAD